MNSGYILRIQSDIDYTRYLQHTIALNRILHEKRLENKKRQHKVIFLNDNAASHTAKTVKETIGAFSWEISAHASYSTDLGSSDYQLFASIEHALAQQRLTSCENARKWFDDCSATTEQDFVGVAFMNCQRKKNVKIAMENISNRTF